MEKGQYYKENLEEMCKFDIYMKELRIEFVWEYVKHNSGLSKEEINKIAECESCDKLYDQIISSSKCRKDALEGTKLMFCCAEKLLSEHVFNVLGLE